MAQTSDLPPTTNFGSVTCCSRVLRRRIIIGVFLMAFGFGWLGVYDAYGPPDFQREEVAAPTIDAVVERIIASNPTAIQTRRTNVLAQPDLVNFSTKLGST